MTLDITQIINWDLTQLHDYILTIKDNLSSKEADLTSRIEQGGNPPLLPIHINYYKKKYYQEFPSKNVVRVFGIGRITTMNFWRDLEYRETELRKIIIGTLDNETTEGRL